MEKRKVNLGVYYEQWSRNFFIGLIKEFRKRGYTDEMIREMATEGSDVLTNFADSCAKYVHTFPFVVGDYTTEEIIKAGKYNKVCDSVSSLDIPMLLPRGERRVVELLPFNARDHSTEYMIRKAEKLGLKRPTREDALHFGKNFPEEQRKRNIVFPHEPWVDSQGFKYIIVLFGDSSKRILGSGHFDSPSIADRTVCAFIR